VVIFHALVLLCGSSNKSLQDNLQYFPSSYDHEVVQRYIKIAYGAFRKMAIPGEKQFFVVSTRCVQRINV